jgi:hypothetical protein
MDQLASAASALNWIGTFSSPHNLHTYRTSGNATDKARTLKDGAGFLAEVKYHWLTCLFHDNSSCLFNKHTLFTAKTNERQPDQE